jgi:hypothetical protein
MTLHPIPLNFLIKEEFFFYQCSKHFQCQKRRFRVFEAGLVLKVFLKLVKISKEQANTLSLIFFH